MKSIAATLRILYAPASDQWQIKGKSVDRFNPTANFTYGTERVSAYRLLEDALNQRSTKIYDTIIDIDGKERRVVNQEQTILAQQKQDAIKEAFQSWISVTPCAGKRWSQSTMSDLTVSAS